MGSRGGVNGLGWVSFCDRNVVRFVLVWMSWRLYEGRYILYIVVFSLVVEEVVVKVVVWGKDFIKEDFVDFF